MMLLSNGAFLPFLIRLWYGAVHDWTYAPSLSEQTLFLKEKVGIVLLPWYSYSLYNRNTIGTPRRFLRKLTKTDRLFSVSTEMAELLRLWFTELFSEYTEKSCSDWTELLRYCEFDMTTQIYITSSYPFAVDMTILKLNKTYETEFKIDHFIWLLYWC